MDFSRKKIKIIFLAQKPQHYEQTVVKKSSVTKNIPNYNKPPQQNPKEPLRTPLT